MNKLSRFHSPQFLPHPQAIVAILLLSAPLGINADDARTDVSTQADDDNPVVQIRRPDASAPPGFRGDTRFSGYYGGLLFKETGGKNGDKRVLQVTKSKVWTHRGPATWFGSNSYGMWAQANDEYEPRYSTADRLLYRPNYMTRERCAGDHCIPCDTSSKDGTQDGCWVAGSKERNDVKGLFVLAASAQSDLTASVLIINVNCESLLEESKTGEEKTRRTLKIGLFIPSRLHHDYKEPAVAGGTVSVFWNDVLVWKGTETGGTVRLPRPLEIEVKTVPGMNQARIVFDRKPGMTARAVVGVDIVGVPDAFTECEDTKVCLGKHGLAEHWEKPESQELRESILLQWHCLHSPTVLRMRKLTPAGCASTVRTASTSGCTWTSQTKKYSGGYAGEGVKMRDNGEVVPEFISRGMTAKFTKSAAKQKCRDLGSSRCAAVTCTSDDSCNVRAAAKPACPAGCKDQDKEHCGQIVGRCEASGIPHLRHYWRQMAVKCCATCTGCNDEVLGETNETTYIPSEGCFAKTQPPALQEDACGVFADGSTLIVKNGAGVVDKATVMISDYPNHTAVCAKWAACLMDAETRRTGGNHMDRVVRILNASDARQAPNLAQLAKQKTTIVRKFEAEETEQLLADIEGGAVVGAHSSNEMGANTEDSLCQMRDCPTECKSSNKPLTLSGFTIPFLSVSCEPNQECIDANTKCAESIESADKRAQERLMKFTREYNEGVANRQRVRSDLARHKNPAQISAASLIRMKKSANSPTYAPIGAQVVGGCASFCASMIQNPRFGRAKVCGTWSYCKGCKLCAVQTTPPGATATTACPAGCKDYNKDQCKKTTSRCKHSSQWQRVCCASCKGCGDQANAASPGSTRCIGVTDMRPSSCKWVTGPSDGRCKHWAGSLCAATCKGCKTTDAPSLAPPTRVSTSSPTPPTVAPTLSAATCRNPFVSDPESWECSCHEIMVKKCHGKDFVPCYRSLLCSSRSVCDSWKSKVCCVDKDEGVKTASKGRAQNCASVSGHCHSAEIGEMVRFYCPKTCGACKGLPQADVELSDVVTGKVMGRHGWAPEPRSPTVNPTEPPLADGGPSNAGETCAY